MTRQLGIFEKTDGINRAVDHAGEAWKEEAKKMLLRFINSPAAQGEFMAEDIRIFAKFRGLPSPPSERAWGAIIVDAIKKGLLVHVGFGKVKNVKAHQANANVYRRF